MAECELYWSIVKILGKTNVEAETSHSTFSSREKDGPFANGAGAVLQTKSLSGENSEWKISA
jgi:hypothetical protein